MDTEHRILSSHNKTKIIQITYCGIKLSDASLLQRLRGNSYEVMCKVIGKEQIKSACWLCSGPTLLLLQSPKTKRWVTEQMPLEYLRTEETTESLP